MQKFAESADAIAATTKKLQKRAILANYLRSISANEAAVSVLFFSGKAFPAWEETTLQVGGSLLWKLVAELSGKNDVAMEAAYRKHGDLGAVAGEILPERAEQSTEQSTEKSAEKSRGLGVLEVEQSFRQIASARGPAAKAVLVRDLLVHATPLEAKYIIKIMTGDLRIGLKESLVEDGIAAAYGAPLADVQRANMLLGDIGETLRFAAGGKLAEAKMRMFHPLGFMLASPIESAAEGLNYFVDAAVEAAVEDKYDGIRAQAHVSQGEVKFFSRTRDDITESFPELPDALAAFPQDAVLDGEIVAWEYPDEPEPSQAIVDETFSREAEIKAANLGQARPFSVLQQRLGRKKVSDAMVRQFPVAYLVFDILYADGELLIGRPLRERAAILDELIKKQSLQPNSNTSALLSARSRLREKIGSQEKLAFEKLENEERASATRIIRAPVFRAASPAELEILFAAAQDRGNEGLMIKDLNSTYSPGKRGKSWLKMKRELATLDVVVTAVEYGHGRRVSVLSDYTFAVWDQNRLVNIGKAYSGLTDVEIVEMTRWFLEHTIDDQGFRRTVEPEVVIEVAFNNMMQSERHESGYALRFPRIVRLRPDKLAADADTIERVREIFAKQSGQQQSV
jgi:DNA ligase-1